MDPISLANCSAGGAPAPAAGEKPLFVAINKSADQQYFIDLQNSFVDDRRLSWARTRRSSMPSSTRTWA